MKEEKKVFVLKDAKGKEVEYESWFSFSSTETGKDYLVCSDNEKDDKGNIKVYVFVYDPVKEEPLINEPVSDAEYKIVEDMIKQMQTIIEEGNEQE